MSLLDALLLNLQPTGSSPNHRLICDQHRYHRRRKSKSLLSQPLTGVHRQQHQQQLCLDLNLWEFRGFGKQRSAPTAARFGGTLRATRPSSSACRIDSAVEIRRALSAASANGSSHGRWWCYAGRVGGLNRQKVSFENGGQVAGGFLRKGWNVGLWSIEDWQRRNVTTASVPSSSSRCWNRHELSAFSGRIAEMAAREFSGAPLAVAWIPGNAQYGRRRPCIAVSAEVGHDGNNHRELRVKQEVHGRRTRVGRPKPCGQYDNIMLQGFNWESYKGSNGKTWWQVLKSQAEELCALGVTDIWLPPPSQSVDRQGYLPGELYNLDASKYGTGAQLKELIDELHTHGISVVGDIVINHRSGKLQDSKGHWNVFKGGNRDKRLDWGPWAVVDDDMYDSGGKGHHDTGESYGAAPDLDHTNKQVQDELTDWMNWLKAEIGFDGWRFDFVKGYAPEYTVLYCQRTNPTIAVGELWTSMAYYDGQLSWDQNGHRQQLCNWIDGTHGASCAFDFTTKGILQRAVECELWRLKDAQGKPPGLIGWWPEKAVTFLDNHDTGSTQRHWAFPDRKVLQGYAYILTHPGIPCIFYDHIYSFKLLDEIKKLLDLRKRHRINAISKVNIQKAEGDIYVAKIDNRVIIKLGPRYDMGNLLPGKDLWKMTLTGPDFAIWETTAPLPPLHVPSVPAEDENQGTIDRPSATQPVHITSKMSAATRNKILREIPELVDNIDALKEKPTR